MKAGGTVALVGNRVDESVAVVPGFWIHDDCFKDEELISFGSL